MTNDIPTKRSEEEKRLLMKMSDFLQCPSEEQIQQLRDWAEEFQGKWAARYAAMTENEEVRTRPGDTLIGTQVVVESMLALSRNSPKALLSPLLDKLPMLRLNIAHFLESIVIHEGIVFVSPPTDFESYVAQGELESLRDFVKPLSPESAITRLKKWEDPIVPTLVLNSEYAYSKLIESPSIAVDKEMLPLFNHVFNDFASRKSLHEIVPIDARGIYHVGIQIWDRWICHGLDLASSNFLFHPEPETGYELYARQALNQTRRAADEKIQETNEWLGQERFCIGAPLILNYILEKTNNREDLLSAAIEIRNSKEATAFRNQCEMFDRALKGDDDKVIVEMISEIRDKIEQLAKRVSGPRLNIDISFPPSITVNPAELWQKIRARRKRHLNFVSHLYEAAITSRDVWVRLGRLM